MRSPSNISSAQVFCQQTLASGNKPVQVSLSESVTPVSVTLDLLSETENLEFPLNHNKNLGAKLKYAFIFPDFYFFVYTFVGLSRRDLE